MKRNILFVITTLLLFPFLCSAQSGIYLDFSSGYAKSSNFPPKGSVLLSKHEIPAFRTAIGFIHDFNSHLGLGFEVGYGTYNHYCLQTQDAQNETIKNTTTEFLIPLVWHISTKQDFSIKLGGIRHTIRVEKKRATHQDKTKQKPMLGTGLIFKLQDHIGIKASLLHSLNHKKINYQRSITALLLGLEITFY